jgi:hypothetical protein
MLESGALDPLAAKWVQTPVLPPGELASPGDTEMGCRRRLQLDRVSDVGGIRGERDNSRIAVQPPAALLVEAARTRVLLEHPQMTAFAAEVTYPRERVVVEPRGDAHTPTRGNHVERVKPLGAHGGEAHYPTVELGEHHDLGWIVERLLPPIENSLAQERVFVRREYVAKASDRGPLLDLQQHRGLVVRGCPDAK